MMRRCRGRWGPCRGKKRGSCSGLRWRTGARRGGARAAAAGGGPLPGGARVPGGRAKAGPRLRAGCADRAGARAGPGRRGAPASRVAARPPAGGDEPGHPGGDHGPSARGLPGGGRDTARARGARRWWRRLRGAGELCSPEPFAGVWDPPRVRIDPSCRGWCFRAWFRSPVRAPRHPGARELIGLSFDALMDVGRARRRRDPGEAAAPGRAGRRARGCATNALGSWAQVARARRSGESGGLTMGRVVKGLGHVAKKVIMDARDEAAALRAAARQEGFEQGRAEGLAAVAAIVTAARDQATVAQQKRGPRRRRPGRQDGREDRRAGGRAFAAGAGRDRRRGARDVPPAR